MPLVLFLFLLPMASLWGQNTPIYHYFKGAVDGKYSITMELKQVGKVLEGNYYYDKYRTNIRIKGVVSEGQFITLKEIDAGGNTTSSTFWGTYKGNWNSIEGQWYNRTRERRFEFDLQAIYLPPGPVGRYNFDHIRRFQELLNYFDAEPRFPFLVHEGMGVHPKWQKTVVGTTSKGGGDYQKVIPYRLAKRYIMNQILLPPEGSYNYFDLPPTSYQPYSKHYKALCKVYKSNRYVAFLCRFNCDTGWEQYDLTFLLLYDYAGHLLDACEVGKVLELESSGYLITADWNSRFSSDGRIEVRGQTKRTNLGEVEVKEQVETVHFYWLVEPNGTLRRKNLVSR